MGKSSKSKGKGKGKKSSKQKRAVHLKNVEVFEKTISSLDKNLHSLQIERKRERLAVLNEQLELSLKVEESYAFTNRYYSYKVQLSAICLSQLFVMIRLQNYVQASIAYDDMMKYPFVEEFQSEMKPFSNLFLVWIERDNVDRKDTVEKNIERKERLDKIAQDSIDIIHRPGARSVLQLLFLHKALNELSRCSDRLFERVEYLSLAMLKSSSGKHEDTSQCEAIARTFLVHSFIDRFRFSKQVNIETSLSKVLDNYLVIGGCKVLSGTEHLAHSLLMFYIFTYEKRKLSWNVQKIGKTYMESLENFIATKSRKSQSICHTCNDEDTLEHEGLVCQGCRVVSYCCKDHQRLNYFHHEVTGTRGLGHKQLCPVFKAFRRKMGNADTSKQGHLDRKFQRACKRFLRGTLQERSQHE